ncbi:MAG: FIST N-terminal domain-containing protein [Candidatus Heimdallarchaeota archaeon]
MIKAAVGLCIDHDLVQATTIALEQAEADLKVKPDLILYFTGSHLGGAKTYNKALAILKEAYSDVPMAGCSGLGIGNRQDYGLKGVGLMMFTGLTAKSYLLKRFRIGTKKKTKKIVKNCIREKKIAQDNNANSTFLFFPPGVGFPKFIADMLNHRIEGINPFFMLNLPIWRRFPILSRIIGKPVEFLLDIAGIGISYSSTWSLFTQLYRNGIHYTGTFGADPLNLYKAFQFYNYRAYKDSLTYISIRSSELVFESRSDTGAEILPDKGFNIDSFIKGGFIPRIQGKWGAHALLDLFGMTDTPDILERCTQSAFYYHPYRPVCVIDSQQKQNLYALAVNPNLKHALITAPNQVVEKLRADDPDHFQAFIADQSRNTIENLLENALEELVTPNSAFGLFFDCGNRAMVIGDRFDKYMKKYADSLGEIPYLVVISGGEVNSQDFPIVNFTTVSNIGKRLNSAF